MLIKVDDLRGEEIAELLREHLADMTQHSSTESMHALELEQLKAPGVTFWTVWDNGRLAGCGALKQLDDRHAELKSMRTVAAYLRKGIARLLLEHILEEAKRRGYARLSLETGSLDFFAPARGLYESFDFRYCDPFADYEADSHSVFMTKEL